MENVILDWTAEMEVAAAGGNPDCAAKSPDFTSAFTVDQTPEEAFEAINDVRGWWSENIEGPTDELGEFTYHNEPVHYSRIAVTELIPGTRVVWRVLENYFSFVEDTREWTGNEIVFDIARTGDKTEVVFTQFGLVPEYECYTICSNAWGGYIKGSLRALIATGKGAPIPAKAS